MKWSNKLTLDLIETYKKFDALWNPGNKKYFNTFEKNVVWDKAAKEVSSEATIDECKKKMFSLLASMRRKKTKIINYKIIGQYK